MSNLLTKQMQEAMQEGGRFSAFRRCLCNKLLKVDEHIRRWHSGVVNYDEALCATCRKDYGDKSRIVCLGCKNLQGFVDPHRSTTGFVFVGRRHYHIAVCPKCKPDIVATQVLEHEAWCRHRKVATKPNWDLFQEIEQKNLQGKAAAVKLWEELNFIKSNENQNT